LDHPGRSSQGPQESSAKQVALQANYESLVSTLSAYGGLTGERLRQQKRPSGDPLLSIGDKLEEAAANAAPLT
jgi:hypothetical protein